MAFGCAHRSSKRAQKHRVPHPLRPPRQRTHLSGPGRCANCANCANCGADTPPAPSPACASDGRCQEPLSEEKMGRLHRQLWCSRTAGAASPPCPIPSCFSPRSLGRLLRRFRDPQQIEPLVLADGHGPAVPAVEVGPAGPKELAGDRRDLWEHVLDVGFQRHAG